MSVKLIIGLLIGSDSVSDVLCRCDACSRWQTLRMDRGGSVWCLIFKQQQANCPHSPNINLETAQPQTTNHQQHPQTANHKPSQTTNHNPQPTNRKLQTLTPAAGTHHHGYPIVLNQTHFAALNDGACLQVCIILHLSSL
jgi:hypothetical protein